MKKTIVVVAAALALQASPAVARAGPPQKAPPAAAQVGPSQQQGLQSLGSDVGLPCAIGGTSVSRKLLVRNNKTVPIPLGTRIEASYTHWIGFVINAIVEQRTVEHRLTSNLLPGQSVEINVLTVVENTGCKAWFDRGLPDLQALEATHVQGQIKLVVKNNNAFAGAAASIAKARLMKCSQIQIGSVDVPVPPIPMGHTVTVSSPLSLPAGFQYFDIIADANNAVSESNESNNTLTGVGVCIR